MSLPTHAAKLFNTSNVSKILSLLSPWEAVSNFLMNSNSPVSHWYPPWYLIFTSPPSLLAREWWTFRLAAMCSGKLQLMCLPMGRQRTVGCRILYITKLSDLLFPLLLVRRFVIMIIDDNILWFNRHIKNSKCTNNEHLWLLFRIILLHYFPFLMDGRSYMSPPTLQDVSKGFLGGLLTHMRSNFEIWQVVFRQFTMLEMHTEHH